MSHAATPGQHQKAAELPRVIGFGASTAIVVGTVIGSGIFLVPHNVARQVGSVEMLFFVWILGGMLSLAGALSLAELGTAIPHTGGVYIYLREAYGSLFAFLYGWAMLFVINSGAIAALAVAFSIYAGNFLTLTPMEQKLLSASVIALLTVVNIFGVRKGAAVQTVFTVAKLAGVALIVGCAYGIRDVTPVQATAPLPVAHTSFNSFGVA